MVDKEAVFSEAISRGQEGKISDFQGWLKSKDVSHQRYESLTSELRGQNGLTVGRENELAKIGEYIGSLKSRSEDRHLVINGVEGSGKTHLSLLVGELLGRNEPEISYVYKTPEEMKDEEKFSSMVSNLKSSDKCKLLVIDDAWKEKRISHVLKMLRDETSNILVMTTWTPEALHMADERVTESFPKSAEIYLEPFDRGQVDELLENVFSIMSTADENVDLSEEYIKEIHDISEGVPGLAVKLTKLSIKQSFHSERELIDVNSVREVADKYGINNIRNKLSNLSETKHLILEKTLVSSDPRGLNPSKIAKELKKDKSTISYHLRDLKKNDLIKKESYGRQTFYTPQKLAKPLIQIHTRGENQFYEYV